MYELLHLLYIRIFVTFIYGVPLDLPYVATNNWTKVDASLNNLFNSFDFIHVERLTLCLASIVGCNGFTLAS